MEEIKIPNVTHCVGCGLRCQAKGKETFESVLCENKKIVVWPEDNYFFIASLNSLIFNKSECILPNGVIFVDFCMGNLLFFISKDWVDKLSGFGMSIVLIADREMQAMAKYWLKERKEIFAVLVVGRGKQQFMHDIQTILHGQRNNLKGVVGITENEMRVLRMLSQEMNVSAIAHNLNCSTKSIYNYQYSLCKKFGGLSRLDELRFKHRIS